MPALPTILFSSFPTENDPLRQSWARFRDQVQARTHTAGVAMSPELVQRAAPRTAAVVRSGLWRLLAPNNRELGRSSFLYTTFVDARAHVLKLRDELDRLVPATVVGILAEEHGWVVSLAGHVVMTCTHWYPSTAAAREAALAAIASLGNATVSEAPLRTTSSGRRTTRVSGRSNAGPAW